MADADTTPDTITLRLVEHGETTIEVDRAEYEQAKVDNLDYFISMWAYGLGTTTVVIEPDGTLYDPYSDAPPRTSLLGRNVTAGVAAIIAAAPADNDCADCGPGLDSIGAIQSYAIPARTCTRHIAEHLVETVRHEQLIIMPIDDADAVLAQAVANATIGRAPRRDMKEN